VPSATKTGGVPAPGSTADDDGCNMSQPGPGGALLWLLVPAALLVYRRRR
jgi:MYXO-CTERM domain-containing protein